MTCLYGSAKSLLQAEEWLYFHRGQARATVFLGSATARTFDFYAGDTAVFPDNSGKVSPKSASRRVFSFYFFFLADFPRCRSLHRKHFPHRKTHLDRDLQERSRGRYQSDPVAGSDPGQHRSQPIEHFHFRCAAIEEGKADPDQMIICLQEYMEVSRQRIVQGLVL